MDERQNALIVTDLTFVPQKQNKLDILLRGRKVYVLSSFSEFQREVAAINTLHNIFITPADCVLRLSKNKASFCQIKNTILPLICH